MRTIRRGREPNLLPKHVAYRHQQEAFTALRDLEYGAIFHEQGLGKTKVAVDLALYWLERGLVDTVLIVVKKGLLANWLRELAVHAHIKPRILSQDRRLNFHVFNSPCRLVLAHYEVMVSELARMQLFARARSVAVILDESARIKNPDSGITRALFRLAPLFSRRIIMTGTPVANRPFDIWAQVWFLDQGKSLGGDYASFRRDYDLSNDLWHDTQRRIAFEDGLSRLYDRISGFSVRETKAGASLDLPEKTTQTVSAEWETRQYEMYCQIRDELRVTIVRDRIPIVDESEDVLKRLLRLVQVASNPRLVDQAYGAIPGKWPVLDDLSQRIVDKNDKGIVWSSFTGNVEWLTHELKPLGAVGVHGGMGMDRRQAALDRFMASADCRFLVATPGAAKEGLTLTVANHVIFYDRGFSLDDYLQAQDRIHRISQHKRCFVYNLMMGESVDGWVDMLLQSKHLAAQLAQGDITHDEYSRQVTYDFGAVVRQILNMPV